MPTRNLLQQLRQGREGAQFERSFRLLATLFHGWCSYQGGRKDCEGEAARGELRAIYFDKFAMVLFRVWDEAFRETGRSLIQGNEVAEAIIAQAVTFPCPLVEVKGKHGRGRAVYDGTSAPCYTVELLYRLQQENLLHYFEITPPKEDPKNPKNNRTIVKPGIPLVDTPTFLGFSEGDFTDRELAVARSLEGFFRRLGPSQIRALGTHESYAKTIEDIRKEFFDPERLGLWDRLFQRLEAGVDFSPQAQELDEYAEEAFRKSRGNRADYAEARQFIQTEITDAQLRECFLRIQRPAEEIWDPNDSAMTEMVSRARDFLDFTRFLTALCFFRDHASERDAQRFESAQRMESQWQRGRMLLHRLGSPNSDSLSRSFDGGDLWPEFRQRLQDLAEKVRSRMRC